MTDVPTITVAEYAGVYVSYPNLKEADAELHVTEVSSTITARLQPQVGTI